VNPEIKRPWAARLWKAKEDREQPFAAVVFPNNTLEPVGFGVGRMAHCALDAACADIDFKPIYGSGFDWQGDYRFDETVGRDFLRSESKNGDIALIYKL